MSDTTPAPQDDWRMRRRGGEGSWIAGVILIVLGLAFLLERAGIIAFVGNWWAIFIYLAALGSFANVWRAYRARGSFGPQAGGSLTWGLGLTVVATIFLLDLSWDAWWPAVVIAVGIGMVASSLLGNATRKPE
jgi:hypothetical protein